jgi:hypothetical protein
VGVNVLETLRALEGASDLSETLESFVSHRLSEAGVWSSPRVSDGVSSYRVVERGPKGMRLCGWIREIDQTQHSFLVDVKWEREDQSGGNWKLFFDVDDTAMSPRRARLAIDAIEDPSQVPWRVELTGRAE